MYQTLWIITNRRTAATRILPSLRPRNSVLTLAFDRPYILRTLYRFYSANIKSEIRNEAIQYSSVQVIGPGKTKHGVLQIREARQLAAEELMDLILVDETTTPPTCRLVISPTLSAKISSQASTASKLLDSPKNKEIIELGHSTVLLVLNTTTAKPDEYAPEKQQTVKHLSTFEALALRRQDEDLILLQVQTGKASDTTHTNEKLVDGTTVESTKEHDSRPVAVCKIYSRKELLEAVQKGKRVFKSAAKTPVAATSMSAPVKIKNEVKDVEIKTAISPHDFEIKLKKVVELLKKGYGVQLKIREPKKGVAGAKIAEKTFMNAKNAITESGLKYEVTEIVKPLPIGGEVPVETETLQNVLKQKKKLSTKPTNMSMTTVDSRRRVKLYKLDEAGVWEDRGTGCVQVKELVWIHVDRETDEATPSKTQTQTESQSNQSKSDTDSSVVLSDSAVADSSNSNSNEINDSHDTNNPSVLLKTRIRSEANFTRQQDTLVVWTEEDGTDMALSFQEQEGCEDLWRAIREIKAKLGGTVSDPGIDNLSRQSEDDDNGDDRGFAFDGTLSLPTPSMGTIKDIEELMFGTSKGAYGRGQLTKFIIEENYIEKMLPLLEMCEDLESFDELYSLAHIVKMIVFLNDSKIYEQILQDDVFPIIVGMLEYDRDYPSAKSTLRQQVASAEFKQLIPFPEALVAKKIKQTYRIQFLRDTALARMLDDATYASLNSIVFFNQAEIISWFVSPNGGEQYLEKVIGILNEEDAGPDAANVKREDVVLFLHELSSVAKGMQTTLRTRYYRIMAKLGLFAIFDYTLVHEDIKIRLAAAAILASILDHNPALVRSFCLEQVKQNQPQVLINLLIKRFLTDSDPGLQSQLCELIRVVIEIEDPTTVGLTSNSTIVSNDSDTDDFLNLFYEKCVETLVSPIMSLEPDTIGNLGGVTGSQCSYICEILCFAIKAHSYRSKYYILGSSVTAKLILLLRAPESYVKLAALRVFRTCIGMKDEFYNRHLLKHDIFSAILQCFRDTGGKYNLLNSACLDVFDFIRKENIKSLVANIVQNHKSMFIDIVYIDTFKSLVLRYEQNQDVPASLGTDETSSAKSIDRPKPDGWSRMDNDEEAYFNDESDDEKEAEENKRKANGNSRNSSEELRQVAGVPKINLIAATNISSSGGGAVNGHAMKRSASPLGLVDYEDDEDDDMIDLIAKKRADTGSIGGTSVKIAGSTTNTLTGGSVTGGVKAVEANIEDVGRVGGDGSGSRRVSFTLNAVAVGAVGAIAAKRRRTGSFSSEDGDK